MTYWYSRTWDIGVFWLVVLFVAVGIFVWWNTSKEKEATSHWTRSALVSLRMLTIGCLLIAMLGWVRNGAETDLPDLVIAIDKSESMGYVDGAIQLPNSSSDGPVASDARFERVVEWLTKSRSSKLEQLSERYTLRFYLIGDRLTHLSSTSDISSELERAESDSTSSRLGQCLNDILDRQRGRPTAGILIFTDGVTTAGPTIEEAAPNALVNGVPLYAVGVGNETPPMDHQLSDLQADEFVFVDDLVTFQALLHSKGLENREAIVQLTEVGESVILDEKRFAIDSNDWSSNIKLSHRPSAEGEYDYQVRVVVDEHEVNPSNNVQTAQVVVRDETIRVLLVQDKPSYEFRFLKQLLGRSRERSGNSTSSSSHTIELTTVQQSAELEYADTDVNAIPIFPVRKEDLFQYDVIIVGDARPQQSGLALGGLSRTDIENLTEFVQERGGGLILVSGPEFMPVGFEATALSALLPYPAGSVSVPDALEPQLTENSIRPTNIGIEFPHMMIAETRDQSLNQFAEFEGPYWIAKVDRLKPGVSVLAETTAPAAPGAITGWPLITFQRIGPGRVLTHFFDESYRWRARTGDLYFERYWIQAIRYLGRQKLLQSNRYLELSSDRREYRLGETVTLFARFLDRRLLPPTGVIESYIESEDGERSSINLRQELYAETQFSGSVDQLRAGRYRAICVDPNSGESIEHEFEVLAPAGELQQLQMNASELQSAAELTRGYYVTLDNADEIWRNLPEVEPVILAPVPPVALWNLWLPIALSLCLFLGLIVTEWTVRKMNGLN